MNRRGFLAMLGAGLVSATGAAAETYADLIVRQLVEQGYVNVVVEVTLLGRVRIRAEGEYGLREIILNPRTGEILRDLWFDDDGNPVVPGLTSPEGEVSADREDDSDNSGSGKDRDEDPEDDREDPEDPEDPEDREEDKDAEDEDKVDD